MKAVIVYDRSGREIRVPSVAECARRMDMTVTTLRNRLHDGRWIHRDGYRPVRVRTE